VEYLNPHYDCNVSRRFKYISEINDFPFVTFYTPQESRIHDGAGEKYGILTMQIRVYVKDEEITEAADDALEKIEELFERWVRSLTGELAGTVVDAIILSAETDEGLVAPLGVCILTAQINYRVRAQI